MMGAPLSVIGISRPSREMRKVDSPADAFPARIWGIKLVHGFRVRVSKIRQISSAGWPKASAWVQPVNSSAT